VLDRAGDEPPAVAMEGKQVQLEELPGTDGDRQG
jgi:hypothetical protein